MKISLSLLFSLIYVCLLSQTGPLVQYRPYNGINQLLHQYGDNTTFPSIGIADDFGPRQLNRATGFAEYDWHGGIDYNSNINDGNNDKGDILLSVDSGSIQESRVTNNGIKRIEIIGSYNFAYVHIFENGNLPITSEGCILKYMNAPNSSTWSIIFQENGEYTAIGPTKSYPSDPYVTFIDENGTLQTIEPFVGLLAAGMPVAALGDSGINGAHLHLHTSSVINNISDAYSKDPLRIVAFNNANYEVDILKEDDITPGIQLVYPGNLTSTVQSRIGGLISVSGTANRYTKTMAIDDVFIKIKKEYQNSYSKILGPYFSSHFSLGARASSIKNIVSNSQTNSKTGNWGKSNLQPYAYSGLWAPYNHNNYDEYYYSDFCSRIHCHDGMNGMKLICDSPSQSRYNDGVYRCICEAVDVRNNNYQGPNNANGMLTPVEFTLDNFMPFVTNVKMFQTELLSIPTQIYELSRHQSEGQTNVIDDGFISNSKNSNVVYNPNTPYELSFKIKTSEPMDYLDIEFNGTNHSMVQDLNDPSDMTWELIMPNFSTLDGACLTFTLTGQDKSGNDLLDIYTMSNNNQPFSTQQVLIPTRQGTAGTNADWSNYPSSIGSDAFSYCFEGCVELREENKLDDDFCLELQNLDPIVVNTSCDDALGSIDLNMTSQDFESIIWYDLDGSVLAQNVMSITDLRPGLYCYEIEGISCCSKAGCIEVVRYYGEPNVEISFGDLSGEQNEVTFTFSGNENFAQPLTYEIYETNNMLNVIDEGIVTEGLEFTYLLDFHISYTVEIEDANGCTKYQTFTVEGETCEDIMGVRALSLEHACPGKENGSITIEADCQHYSINWTGPNSSELSGETIENLAPGTYCVWLQSNVGLGGDCLMNNQQCQTYKCFEVLELEADDSKCTCEKFKLAPLVENICIATDGPSIVTQYGLIDIEVKGGQAPFTISWHDEEDLEEYGFHRIISEPGTYCATITDECGYKDTQCWEIIVTEADGRDGCSRKVPPPNTHNFALIVPNMDQDVDIIESNLASVSSLLVTGSNYNLRLLKYNVLYRLYGFESIENGEIYGTHKYTFSNNIQLQNYFDPEIENIMEGEKFDKVALRVYPSPFENEINIEVNSETDQRGSLRLIDINGKVIFFKYFPLEAGINKYKFEELDKLSSGMYYLIFDNEIEVKAIPIVKK